MDILLQRESVLMDLENFCIRIINPQIGLDELWLKNWNTLLL